MSSNTVNKSTYEGRNKAKHEDKEDKASQQVFVNKQSLIVTLATKSGRNVVSANRYWSKGDNPEDDENFEQSRRQRKRPNKSSVRKTKEARS